MFDQLSEKISGLVERIASKKQSVDDVLSYVEQELRDAMLAADVAPSVIDAIRDRVRSRLRNQTSQEPQVLVENFIKGFEQGVLDMLGASAAEPRIPRSGTSVWMLVGLQGTGKTTTTAKIARWAKSKDLKPYLVPLDLRRPAAVQQLQKLGRDLGVPVMDVEPDGKPIKLAQRAVAEAQKLGCNLVLLDTAGRLSIDHELMDEVGGIRKKLKPDEVLLVVDGMQGQTSVETARAFDQYVSLTGLILTKMDGDARGGAALSARHVTGKPIKFMGVGEKVDEFELFDPAKIVNRILDRGDLEALASKAESALDMNQVESLGKKMLESKFTLDDFRAQIEQMEKLGSMESVLKMLPGGKKVSNMLGDMDGAQREMRRTKAIINSMTPQERRNSKLLLTSHTRRQRIAKGSGVSLGEVQKLLKDFDKMQKMMKQLKNMNPQMMAQMAKGLGKGNLPF